MRFVKDKSSIKYYLLALICVLCVYSCKISELFVPIFNNVYYGNLVKMFVALSNLLIWGIEFLVMFFVCKKLGIKIFTKEELKGKELPLWRLILLFVLVLLPIFIISAYLHFKVKIVYQLGIRVTSVGLACNACEILSWAMRMVFMVLFIHFVHLGIEKNIQIKNEYVSKYFPWGAILSFLVFGLIDFFAFPVDLNWFYLIATFWYGVIYLVAGRKFSSTYILSYIIWLL